MKFEFVPVMFWNVEKCNNKLNGYFIEGTPKIVGGDNGLPLAGP